FYIVLSFSNQRRDKKLKKYQHADCYAFKVQSVLLSQLLFDQ
ncbi:MAG: hypothetical protein ACI9RU_002640, partial [Litorivivens sp.]